MLTRPKFALLLGVSILASASTWFYMVRILKAHQVTYAVIHQQPRGNLSDLYPRWLAARELLLHRQNPYSEQITLEIQKGYYGRPLDPSRPEDPKDQEAFAYPAYVVFLLAPTVKLPFEAVQAGFRWLLFVVTGGSVFCWLQSLRWRLGCTRICLAIVLVLGSIPIAQGIRLQQLSLLVAGFLAACAVCLARGHLLWAGSLLALATIKPQLAWPLVLWLLLWAVHEWRPRHRFLIGFFGVMTLLLVGSEMLLPRWGEMFLDAIRNYHRYTHNQSVMQALLGAIAGRITDVLAFVAAALCLWPLRRESQSGAGFGRAFALVMALTVLIVPMSAPYNQVLLIPAVLLLLKEATPSASLTRGERVLRAAAALPVVWPWFATLALGVAYFVTAPGRAQNLWAVPLYMTFLVPVIVFALTLLQVWNDPSGSLRLSEPSE